MSKESCEFCKIVEKKSPASIVYQDKLVLAFLDIRPFSEGHTLVITKNHYEAIYDVPAQELSSLFGAVQKISIAAKDAMSADGISIVQNNGKAADQHIFHIHVHVIPRHTGRRLLKPEEAPEISRKRLNAIAKLIRQQLLIRLHLSKKQER